MDKEDRISMQSERGEFIYHYNPKTENGYMEMNAMLISIDSEYNADKVFGMGVSHPNYLTMYFANQRAKHLVHEAYDCTMQDQIARKMIATPLCSECVLPRKPDHLLKKTYKWKVATWGRELLRSLFAFVTYLHGRGKAMGGFSYDNLVIVKGELKFWKVRFRDESIELRNQDITSIELIIKDMFRAYNEPKDIRRLRTLIGDYKQRPYSWSQLEKLLVNHLSLLSPSMRLTFFRDCDEKGNFLYGKDKILYMSAVISIEDALTKDWKKKFDDKALGPVYDCFNFKRDPNDKNLYTEGDSKIKAVRNPVVLRCSRNLVTHLPEVVQKMYKSHPDKKANTRTKQPPSEPMSTSMFLEEDLDVVIMYLFADVIMDFQEKLMAKNILNQFFD